MSNHVSANLVGWTVVVKIMSLRNTLNTPPWECLDWTLLGKGMVKEKDKGIKRKEE